MVYTVSAPTPAFKTQETKMADRPPDYKLIKGGRLIDGLGGPPMEGGAVLVQGSKILAAGPPEKVVAPDGAQVDIHDYPGQTVMPGMVDAHTHHNSFGDGRSGDELAKLPDEVLALQSARNARASLFSGVTSIRENGPKHSTMYRLREAICQGIAVGPRMVLCGPPLAIIGGHMGYFGTEVTGTVEARALTRQRIKEGADYIKITATGGSTRTSFPLRPSFNVDELKAITEETHKFGKLAAAHCVSTRGIVNALDAGVDMIIHCVFRDADGTDNFRDDLAERIAEQGVYVNPTLHIGRSAQWALQKKKKHGGLTPEEQAQLDQSLGGFEIRLEHCGRMIEMGLKVITGSDSSWNHYKLGNTILETECLVMSGYSPMHGLLSVTSESAKSIGIDHIVGTIEPGKEADIIVVDGNPAERLNDLWNVTEVFLAGQRVDRGSKESLAATRQWPPDA